MIEPNEMWIVILVFLVIIVSFTIMSILFSQGKAFFLISGYNMLPKSKKDAYDTKKLGRFMAAYMLVTSSFMVLLLFAMLLNLEFVLIFLVILMIVTMIGLLIYANTGNRLKKTNEDGIESSRYYP